MRKRKVSGGLVRVRGHLLYRRVGRVQFISSVPSSDYLRGPSAPTLSRVCLSLSSLQILPTGDLTKGPGGFFNATLTLDANQEDRDGLLGRYICLG